MSAILLGWNPDQWNDWNPDYSTVVDVVAATGFFHQRWSVRPRHDIEPGTDAWLLVHGRQCGVIGHAVVASVPYRDTDHTDPAEDRAHVDVLFDILLPQGEQIPPEVLSAHVPSVRWTEVREGGSRVPPEEEKALRALWAEHVPPSQADLTTPVPGTLPAEALSWVVANRFERDPQARRACIAQHGTSCAACGFSFETVYGDFGRGFIHIHHIVPASQLGPNYQLDPLTDLVPLCPNCHAMAHQGGPTNPLTPAELRQVIARSGHLEGTVMSDRELQAQQDAGRLLGP